MIISLPLRAILQIHLFLFLMFSVLNISANPYQAVCEKVAKNDLTVLDIVPINSPKDAKIDLNNDGVYESISCSNSCYFDDGASGEYIGSIGPDGWGENDYHYYDIFMSDGKTFIRHGIGTKELNAPEMVSMYSGTENKTICSIYGEWTDEEIQWHKNYAHLKNVFNSKIPIDIATPKHAPIEIISFERDTNIKPLQVSPSLYDGYNVVRNYDYIDFDNDGINEYIAEAIHVLELGNGCHNTHLQLVKVDENSINQYPNTDVLNKVAGNVGECGNPTFYFRYNNEFFIKQNNKIITVQGNNLVIVAERIKTFKVKEITYHDN